MPRALNDTSTALNAADLLALPHALVAQSGPMMRISSASVSASYSILM